MNDAIAWTVLDSQTICTTPRFEVTRDRLRLPAGEQTDYFVVRPRCEAAGVVALDAQGRVLLVQQWRHVVQRLLWEVPAGAIDPGESPRDAAARELQEETGHAATTVEPLCRYHPAVGPMAQTFHLFVATGLREVGRHDPAEIHATRFFTRAELESMLDRGEIADGMTLTGLLTWLRRSSAR